jgi:hypothetical protein
MPLRTRWKRIPANSLDSASYGRVVRAARHPCGALLVHEKHCARNTPYYRRFGTWRLYLGGECIGVHHYGGLERKTPPIRWANAVLRDRGVALGSWAPPAEGPPADPPPATEAQRAAAKEVVAAKRRLFRSHRRR